MAEPPPPFPVPPPQPPDPALGSVLRRLREGRGLTRGELAERARLDVSILKQVEEATIDPPWTTVEAIALGLEVPVSNIAGAVERYVDADPG